MGSKNSIEVCFTPAIYSLHHNPEAIVVVVDILRATSAICTAFMNGVKHIIPVATKKEAKEYKNRGYMVAAERDGLVLDFADFGNSPYNFTRNKVENKDIVYSTTNGTNAIHLASSCYRVVIGSYLNISSLTQWLVDENRDVVILCAGWKNRFSLEDSLFAGALSQKLIDSGLYETICDSVHCALDIWKVAKNDLNNYILKAAQKSRLAKNGLDDVIDYCHTFDLTNVIPIMEGNLLKPYLVESNNDLNNITCQNHKL
ncbi:MAG: 2-phosphosulfolactate phosphatase [Marinilabiliaceae bacterium]|nr:2-phosphosulfolactate phosphatase [Marinilabiliaceae bacterium]